VAWAWPRRREAVLVVAVLATAVRGDQEVRRGELAPDVLVYRDQSPEAHQAAPDRDALACRDRSAEDHQAMPDRDAQEFPVRSEADLPVGLGRDVREALRGRGRSVVALQGLGLVVQAGSGEPAQDAPAGSGDPDRGDHHRGRRP